jgi:iron complex transport system substrate-binding protein
VLPLSRRGWVSGSDSFVSSLLTETGLFNAAGDLGVGMGGFASLEAIVNLKPDFILVSQAGDHARDDGQAFLLHPALARFYPPARRIVIPERLTECGGVMLAQALDVLVAELKRVGR